MKLKIDEFENYAKRNGVSANTLLKKLGGGKLTYNQLKQGKAIGYDVARNMYNALGEWIFLSLIDFEGETLDGFKSKFVQVGNKLY